VCSSDLGLRPDDYVRKLLEAVPVDEKLYEKALTL